MRILKAIGGAMIAVVFGGALVSCGTVHSITPAAKLLPPEQRVTLETSRTKEEQNQMCDYADSKFGGFTSRGDFFTRQGYAGPGVVVAINGQYGRYFERDKRGCYAASSVRASIVCEPGKLKIISIPIWTGLSENVDHVYEFQAKPGHRYFIGNTYQFPSPSISRWLPMVYDKTEGKVIPLEGMKPHMVRLPNMGGPPTLIVL
ncbi:hypothetical protein KBB96_13620 [Luteolibacter ambystomatis]|uniref:Lipoprotein n=1 Tax=Luteolibacter ambystomatis TaxID=2824561 RepID=A0A975IYH9_9BACT|nr:hypothetical protein [Luteolibacter ambystomatis]QUE49903.1 hypothetical protein KBB96_13620 [Luteolibacter ambystomatis]